MCGNCKNGKVIIELTEEAKKANQVETPVEKSCENCAEDCKNCPKDKKLHEQKK